MMQEMCSGRRRKQRETIEIRKFQKDKNVKYILNKDWERIEKRKNKKSGKERGDKGYIRIRKRKRNIYIYIDIYVCVCVERERERE